MCVRCTRFSCTSQAQRALARLGLRPVLCCAQPPRAAEREVLQQQLQAAYDAGFERGYAEGAKVDIKVTWQKGGMLEAQEDTLARSALKGLIWRLFSTGMSIAVALLVFSDVEAGQALTFGGAGAALKFLMYFVFERLWLRLRQMQLPEWPP